MVSTTISPGFSTTDRSAISTLLQPPIVRTGLMPHTSAPASSAHKPPTARDIPPVALTNIPTVDPGVFTPYLSQVGAMYDALQRAKENEEEGGTQVLRKGSKADDFADLLEQERRSSRNPNLSRQSSLVSLASAIEFPTPRRRSSGGGRRAIHATTPLSTIPPVYFEEDFHLENPRTFDIVSERSEVVRPAPGSPDERRGSNGNLGGPRKALATNAILQEKLSWYLDTIEVHLISSISTASTSFFAALGSLKELHSEAADSVERIQVLRKELATLDEEMAIGGLNIVNQRRRRENLGQLSDAVQQLKSIIAALSDCEALVDTGDVERAMDAIDRLETLSAGETASEDAKGIQLRDLRGASALRGVGQDLNTLRFHIGKTFEARLLSGLLGDLRRHIESVSTTETLQRWSSASQRRRNHNREQSAIPAYLAVNDALRTELFSILGGLHRVHHTSTAAITFRESVLREIRAIVRRPLPASNDEDADSIMSASTLGGRQRSQQEKSSILARNLRALDPDDAEELLKKTYIGVGETLRRLGTQVKVLLDVTSQIGDPAAHAAAVTGIKSPPRSPNVTAIDGRLVGAPVISNPQGREIQEEMHQALDMSNLLGQAVDIAQDKIVKILRVRSEQSTHLSVERFLRYFNLNLLFANECEAVSGRSGLALKNVVNGHIKDFVSQLGETERQSLATGMEADPWNAKDFVDDDREHLSRILSASTQDAEAWYTGSRVWLPASSPSGSLPTLKPLNGLAVPHSNGLATSGTSTPTSTPSKSTTRPALIDSESFLLPESAIRCMHGLSSFLHLCTGLPSMTSDIASSMVSYLSLFNSRCTQLILGAGATRSAGLKNITTKHLALAAQALSFISSLIPHVREFVRRHAGSGASTSSLIGEFDKVRRAYLEHQHSIYEKLVDIMSGRATAHAKTMKTINWEITANAVNTYMETLTKETSTLHRVLGKHLPADTVRGIMQPVFKSYKEQWTRAFGDVVLKSEDGRNRYVTSTSYSLSLLCSLHPRMLRDAEYFKTRIGDIDGAGDVGDYLMNLVKEKSVPKAVVLEPVPAPANGKTSGESAPSSNVEKKVEDKGTNEDAPPT